MQLIFSSYLEQINSGRNITAPNIQGPPARIEVVANNNTAIESKVDKLIKVFTTKSGVNIKAVLDDKEAKRINYAYHQSASVALT